MKSSAFTMLPLLWRRSRCAAIFRMGAADRLPGVFRIEVTLILQHAAHTLHLVYRHFYFPRFREHLWVVNGDFIGDGIRGCAREPLGQFQCITMKISDVVEPRLSIEAD